MIMFDKDGEPAEIFRSVKMTARTLGHSNDTIYKRCRGKYNRPFTLDYYGVVDLAFADSEESILGALKRLRVEKATEVSEKRWH